MDKPKYSIQLQIHPDEFKGWKYEIHSEGHLVLQGRALKFVNIVRVLWTWLLSQEYAVRIKEKL